MPIKHPVKMLLYANPGVGKSVFASKFPKPFFICTDGNYDWLLDFGAKPEDHVNISSYAEFEKIALTSSFEGYDTIVVDLIEDIYKWNEAEYCRKQGVDHLSDAGGFGKGWDITRTRLFVACSKLLSLPKNVIFLSHESSYTTKDRRGNETTHYTASNLMSEKFVIMLEGRLRYFLHAKFKDEVLPDGKVITHRVLSLVPKSDEYGIIRGVNTSIMPEDIELDADVFLQTIGYDVRDTADDKKAEPAKQAKPTKAVQAEPAKVEVKVEPEPIAEPVEPVTEQAVEPVAEPVVEQSKEDKLAALRAKLASKKPEPVVKQEEPVTVEEPNTVKVETIYETVEPVQEEIKPAVSQQDKIAAILAKLGKK